MNADSAVVSVESISQIVLSSTPQNLVLIAWAIVEITKMIIILLF